MCAKTILSSEDGKNVTNEDQSNVFKRNKVNWGFK